MRSADEIRAAKLSALDALIKRPGMYATTGHEAESVSDIILGDLCFLDERDTEVERVRELRHAYGQQGIVGAFQAVFGEECNFVAEVVSVYARWFWECGYLTIDHVLPEAAFDALVVQARTCVEGNDVRHSEVIRALGEPSLDIDGRVACYAGADGSWASFDCWESRAREYRIDRGQFDWPHVEDPLMRNGRLPAATFSDSLLLTNYGKLLRWGPGWWLRSEEKPSAPVGVAEQLREIADSDPSQSLGPRRP